MITERVEYRSRDGRTVIGRVAMVDWRHAWLRIERVTGYWSTIPDPDELYAVPVNAAVRSGR